MTTDTLNIIRDNGLTFYTTNNDCSINLHCDRGGDWSTDLEPEHNVDPDYLGIRGIDNPIRHIPQSLADCFSTERDHDIFCDQISQLAEKITDHFLHQLETNPTRQLIDDLRLLGFWDCKYSADFADSDDFNQNCLNYHAIINTEDSTIVVDLPLDQFDGVGVYYTSDNCTDTNTKTYTW